MGDAEEMMSEDAMMIARAIEEALEGKLPSFQERRQHALLQASALILGGVFGRHGDSDIRESVDAARKILSEIEGYEK